MLILNSIFYFWAMGRYLLNLSLSMGLIRRCSQSLSLHGLNTSMFSISLSLTLWDSANANTLRPLASLHKRALKAILLKPTTLAISDYNFLFILPLKKKKKKKRLNYNKGVLMHRVMSEKVPPSLTAEFSLNGQSRHSGKLNIPIPRTDLFKSSLEYSGSLLWSSFHGSLKLSSSSETFKSRYMSYT